MPLTIEQERARCALAEAWLSGGEAPDGPAGSDASPPREPEFTLRVSAHPAATSWVVPSVFLPSFDVLRRMSKGRIDVVGHWGESAHPAREGFAALADGRTDFAPCYTSWEPERFPLSQLLALPDLFPSTEVATAASEALYKPFLQAEFERPGVILGRLKATGPYHLFSRRDLARLSDLQGLRIATNAGIDSRIAAALGAHPVALSSVDLLPAYLAGQVDAVSLADGSADVFGVGRHSRTRLEIGVSMMNLEFGLGERFHDSLPPDLRAVLNAWLRAQAQAEGQYFYGVGGALARDKQKEAGCRFVSLGNEDRTELNRRMAALTDDVASELDARGLAGSSFVNAARQAAQRLAGQSANDLMRDAIEHPRWLLPEPAAHTLA